jgi:hypothetical protein
LIHVKLDLALAPAVVDALEYCVQSGDTELDDGCGATGASVG